MGKLNSSTNFWDKGSDQAVKDYNNFVDNLVGTRDQISESEFSYLTEMLFEFININGVDSTISFIKEVYKEE